MRQDNPISSASLLSRNFFEHVFFPGSSLRAQLSAASHVKKHQSKILCFGPKLNMQLFIISLAWDLVHLSELCFLLYLDKLSVYDWLVT